MSDSSSDALAAAYAHCAELVRTHDNDRFRATLFAPAEKRGHLHALHAFSHEIASVRAKARDPMAGEIRHQWWRDALSGEARGDIAANPVAAALLDTIKRFKLPRQALIDLIDARTFDLYEDPMPSLGQLEGYCGETSSSLIRLASIILADGIDPGGADAAGHAGVAWAMVGLMRALPWHARAGQLFIPKDMLDRHGVTRDDIVAGRGGPGLIGALADLRAVARGHWDKYAEQRRMIAPAARAAFLPVALVPAYLKKLAGAHDPLSEIVDLSPIRKMWILWRAS